MKEKLMALLQDDNCPLLWIRGDVADLADFLLANEVTVLNWISVSKQLPTEKDADITGCVLAIEVSDGFARRWEIGKLQRHPELFTHWMSTPPLPSIKSTERNI